MPRAQRISIPNCLYYINSSSNPNQNIFTNKTDYQTYLELLAKEKEKYGFKVFSFALMPNQLELLLELKEKNPVTISVIMHHITSSYTKYFNSTYQRKGHLFRGRFKSILIEKEPYILSLVHYIHSRPKILGAADENITSSTFYNEGIAENGMIARIKKTISMEEEVAEICDLVKKRVSPEKTFADYTAAITVQELEELSNKLHRAWILGSEEFVESVKRKIGQKKPQDESKKFQVESVRKEFKFKPQILIYASFILVFSGVLALVAIQRFRQNDIAIQKGIPIQKGTVIQEKADAQIKTEKSALSVIPVADLDGTKWTIEIKQKENTQARYPRLDKIVFKDGKVYSDYLLATGYGASNYSLSIKDDGILVWETAQYKTETQEIAFLRGELTSTGMLGELVLRSKEGQNTRFEYQAVIFRS